MKLFVPIEGAENNPHYAWLSIRGFIEDKGVPMDDDCISSLRLDNGERIAVGEVFPDLGEEVVAIFKIKSFAGYYVCSRNSGVMEGEPLSIEPARVAEVTEFEDQPGI